MLGAFNSERNLVPETGRICIFTALSSRSGRQALALARVKVSGSAAAHVAKGPPRKLYGRTDTIGRRVNEGAVASIGLSVAMPDSGDRKQRDLPVPIGA